MQLFITDGEKRWNKIILTDERICKQIRTVLRMQLGDIFFVQMDEESSIVRYKLSLATVTKVEVMADIIEQEIRDVKKVDSAVYVAIPNKMQKLELICQKLTEIWLWRIVLRKAERSQLRDLSDNKMERLSKIILEAAEQSWSWQIPVFAIVNNFECVEDEMLIANMNWETVMNKKFDDTKSYWLLVWPEGWLTENDIKQWWVSEQSIIWLWKHVLRMETAAIIGAWCLVNR